MQQRSTAVNVLTAIAAVLLSLVLVIVLFATGLVGIVRMSVTPKAIEDMITRTIQSVDFEQIIIDSAADNHIGLADLTQAQMMDKLMGSEAAQEFFGLYAKDVAAAISGTYSADSAAVNKQTMQALLDVHLEDLVTLLGDVSNATRDQIRDKLLAYVDQNMDVLLGKLAVENLLQNSGVNDIVTVINMLPTILLWILIGACVVLAALVYACRYYRCGGLMWVGADTALAALLVLGGSLLLKSDLPVALLGEADAAPVLTALFGAVGSVFDKMTLILFGIAVLFIGGYIVLRCTVLKNNNAASGVGVAAIGTPAAEPLSAMEETL